MAHQGPIFEVPSEITFLMVTPSPELPETSQLESGVFYWNHLIGITEAEARFARDGNSHDISAPSKQRLRSRAWLPTMAIAVVLVAFYRRLRRRRRSDQSLEERSVDSPN
jgi:hypothetical protein